MRILAPRRMMKSSFGSRKTAMSTALNCLSRRAFTVALLSKRLEEKGFQQEEIQETINKLIEWKYLNDQDYAISYIKSKRDKFSKRRTMMELQKAGIDHDQTIDLMEQSYTDDQEYQNCLQLAHRIWEAESIKWERKYKDSIKHQNISREIFLKKRVGDKLFMRGFPIDSVKKVFAHLLAENN